jgi:hypothetical protein
VLFVSKDQKIRRVLSDIEQTKLYNGVTFASTNLCPMLVIAFGGGPMTNILLYNVRSTDPQPSIVRMAASSFVFLECLQPSEFATRHHTIAASAP